MLEYIKGILVELTPTTAIIETSTGLAYNINITVNSYSQLNEGKETKIFLQQIIREDAHLLFGFVSKIEREVFRLLLSVNGVGANTARIILSSLTVIELKNAIIHDDINVIKSVKGIGIKTAQRIIIDLKDKIIVGDEENKTNFSSKNNTLQNDALKALMMLGYNKQAIEKVLSKIINDQKETSLELVIKKALNYL